MAGQGKSFGSGEALVRQKIITREDLEEAQHMEEETGTAWYRQLLQKNKLTFERLNDVLHYEFHSKAKKESHMSLGDALVQEESITKEQLREALEEQRRSGHLLGKILQERGYATAETISKALSRQYSIPYVDASETLSDQEALDLVPESVAKQKDFVPVGLDGDRLTVLVSGPQSPGRLEDAGVRLGVRIMPLMTTLEDIKAEIEDRYRGGSLKKKSGKAKRVASPPQATKRKSARPAKQEVEVEQEHAKEETDTVGVEEIEVHEEASESVRFEEIARQAEGVPVIKLVSTIVEGAVNSGATDVHLDPQEPEMRVRYRIDGVLHDVMSIPPDIESAVVSRLKIMADIDITETRHPQDGHISMEIGGDEYDVRVASLPTYLGERMVLRLLDQSSVLAGVKDLGLEPEDQKKLTRLIESPYGMILVTGPTGSGKTTTLYSCLNQKNVMTDSIVTLEDPVEYQLSGINQVQIENDIDLTFAHVLRASLRQDIDVLLVGEIRDPETARIAIRAAMTGHLVFSTLHTNDAPEAIATLRNMGVPSYLIASALTAVVAQRLIRQRCPDCKASFVPSKALVKSVGLPESTKRLYRGKGCDACYHTGTRGRTGIFEILEVTPSIRKMIAAEDPIDKITKASKMKFMSERCRQKMKQGQIPPEEFLRVIRT